MITGYNIIELLHECKRFKVVRASRTADNTNVILKFFVQEPVSQKDLKNLADEFHHACQISSDYVIKYYNLYEYSPNKWVFIQEDINGISLAKAIPPNGFDIAEFLKIGVKVLLGLQAIHQQNIIHKDIKPSNIIINSDSGDVKITDFGCSTQLKQEKQSTLNFSLAAGTLAYISPEQTGRINRNMDYRTDFYSLGITFYELLIGKVPFSGADAMNTVHQHIAKQPLAPHKIKKNIPLFLSQIIMKLLAKNPEERYQSCQGILYDLNRCVDALQTGCIIPVSELGKQDYAEHFTIPQKLYGREKEIAVLLEIFERTSCGKAEALMVTGHAGIGKTALINEIQKPLTLKKGYFISGKFDQLNKATAYSAIIQAFQGLIKQLLVESEERFNYWKKKLCNALGNNGQLITDIIPEIESIVGRQPNVPVLDSTEAKNRFNLVFKNFISVFMQKEHPLVLFLDDLQWVDFASLELIKQLISDPETQYFFLIGAYRDNEVTALHPMNLALEELKKSHVTIHKIVLASLDSPAVEKWLTDTLHCSPVDIKPLAEIVYQKTQGNPFFIKVFLQALYDEKLLTRITTKTWHWDLQRIRTRQATDNVGEFMVSCIHQLPTYTQQLLTLASCFGHQVTFHLLNLVAQKTEEQILQELQTVFNMGLIYRDDSSLYFAHDRVQEAAYSLLSDENKKQTHLLIGRIMLHHYSVLTQPEIIFDLVDHFNKSQELIQADPERMQLATLNFEAGKRAKKAIAYQAALNYLHASLCYLKHRNMWADDYPLAFALYKEVAEVEYLNGYFEKSYNIIQQMQTFIKNPIELAEVNLLLLIQKTLEGKYLEATNIGCQSLKQLGIELPEVEFKTAIQQELTHVQAQLQNRTIDSLLALPTMVDPEKMAAMKLLFNLTATTYISNLDLYFVIGLKMVRLSLQYGHVPESCIGYTLYGSLLCMLEKYQQGYEFADLGLKLSQEFHNARVKCRVMVLFMFLIYHWAKPASLTEIKKIAEAGYQAGLESGELQFAAYLNQAAMLNSFYHGNFLANVASEEDNQLVFADKTKNQLCIDTIKAMQLAVSYLMNPLPKAVDILGNIMDHRDFEKSCVEHKSFLALCFYQILKAHVCYLMEDYTQALDSILAAQKNLIYVSGFVINVTHNVYYSLILIKRYPQQSEEAQKNSLLQLEKNQKQLRSWANSCPENFLHHYILVEAEITAHIKHNRWEALELYNQAVQLAHENKFLQDEALANELAAVFFNVNSQEQYAKDHLQKAHDVYRYWGATAKVQHLEKAYPQLLSIFAIPKAFESRVSTTEESYLNLDRLNLQTVLKASQIISSEVDLTKFLHTMMVTLLEHAGAEKGTFFMVDKEQVIIMVQGQGQHVELNTLALKDWQNGSPAVIHYINRTKQPLIIDNAFKESKFKTDAYIQTQQTKSVLGMPIMIKGMLKAILYLENNLTSNAFTPSHVEILTILTNQIAISLENVNLYEAIRKNERRYRTLAETTHAVVWSANGIGHFVTPQESWTQFTGQTWEQYQKLGWLTAIHPDDHDRIMLSLTHAISTQNCFRELIRAWSRDGYYKYLMLHAVPLMNEKNEITEWMGTCLDIHALKQTEEQLRAATNNLNLALSSANVGTWSLDLFSNRVEMDANMFMLLDIDPDNFHHTLEEACMTIHPDDREYVDSLVKRCIVEHIDYEAEYRVIKKDESIHYIYARGKIFYKEDKSVHLTGSAWDITLKKERQHLQEVETYRKKLEEFIDTLCHELRNPLTGIYGSAGLLRSNIETFEKLLKANYEKLTPITVEKLCDNFKQTKEQLHTLEICAQQQKIIVDDVLDLSKLDSNKIELVSKAFSLKALITSLLQMVNPQVIQKKLNIEADLPEGDCLLKADSYRLSQIILNLLTNAVKFTQEGSVSIIASINLLPSQEILLQISVKDTGVGMTLEEQDKLFERFSQANRTTSQEYGGTGLGLIISKKLIEKMGGKIQVTSKKWHGTTFSFTVKCGALTEEEKIEFYNTSKKRALPQEETPNIKTNKTILVVDDNIINQKILVRNLENKGYFCQVANDGIEALSKCEQFYFDLIFMDVEMPRMNGLDATRRIRAEETNKNNKTPIVGLSGNARKEQISEALKAGMNDYLTKPYHQSDIEAKTNQFIEHTEIKISKRARNGNDHQTMSNTVSDSSNTIHETELPTTATTLHSLIHQ